MEFEKVISERRSVRRYKAGTSIDKKTVEAVIAAAQQAPSWKNSQTGRYYAAVTPQKLEQVRDALPEFNRNNSKNAPVLIVTAYEKGTAGFMPDGTQVNELGDGWGAYDLGLQNAYLVLKARELGYDTLIMGIRDEKKLREAFSIPDTQQVAAVLALGVREADPTAPQRKNIDEIAVFE
ncbi:MAG: nitroreductase family protein [Firmicutes bacterium]|nr:nitroreductase family protein [Bacillota bacterium]